VVGFEPNLEAIERLQAGAGPDETYLPWAIGDGERHTLHVCAAAGMSSLLSPDHAALKRFGLLAEFGAVVGTREVQTRRLDDLPQMGPIDLLVVDVQGSELAVLRSGRLALRVAVAVHTKLPFVTLYRGQPTLGELDAELRAAGLVPHTLRQVKRWPLSPVVFAGDPRRPGNQVLEAEVVYVRDLAQPAAITDEQLKQLALVAHHCYESFDLAAQCLRELIGRGSVGAGALEAYFAVLSGEGLPVGLPVNS
jgi:FkbM family methyltransferase